MNTQELNRIDPLKRQPELGVATEDISPMDPPDAYSPPAMNRVAPDQMHPFLRTFTEEHALFMEELKVFEEAIFSIQKTGFTKELDGKLRHFFHFFDSDFVPHSQLEESALFPLLHQRLIVEGEHSPIGAGQSEVPTTAVDLMRADHLKAVQLAAVILNFLGLAFRLPDEKSRLIVLDTALEQGKNLVELLRLHIFREDNILFSLAYRLISATEFDRMSG